MNEARIKTSFGEIVIPYSNLDELKKALDEMPGSISLIQSKTVGLVATAERKPKPGLETIYDYDANGRLRLLKKPTSGVALAALALYLNDPEQMTAADLESVTGIVDVSSSVIRQTNNKKYFMDKKDGRFGISPDGFQWVANKVIPGLKKT